MAKSKRKKSPGRPKGSKNSNLPTTRVRPPACPHCQCTRRAVVRVASVLRHGGIHDDGSKYNVIETRIVRCESCGMHRPEKEYHYDMTQVA